MKKFFALVLALALVMSLALPAFADESTDTETTVTTYDLSIKGDATGHIYQAYQIFSGDISSTEVMTNVEWGNGIIDGEALLAALKDDETELVNPTDGTKYNLKDAFASATDAKSVAKAMASWGNNSVRVDRFAEIVSEYLAATPTKETTSQTTTYVFEDLPSGYYLIKDKDDSLSSEANDFYTKFIIDLSSSLDVEVKGSVPSVTKGVSEELNGSYTEEISNQLSKTHYYEWIGTVPTDIADYDHYYYKFTDTLSAGLTFDRFEQIYILHNGGGKTWIVDESGVNSTQNTMKPSAADANGEGDTTPQEISITWNDLKAVYPGLLASDKIVVKYSAYLNENAIIGSAGNDNKVSLTYSNNPHDENDKGKTPEDEATVYSFKLKVTKVNETNNVLAGAEFVLYHNHTDTETNKTTAMYAKMEATGEGNEKKITGWTDKIGEATKLTTGNDGVIEFEGLEKDTVYWLRETKAPVGYNKLTADVQVKISDFAVDENDNIVSLDYSVNSGANQNLTGEEAKPGQVSATVENKSGTTLPSTGGIGTTLFYVFGGLMVAGAAVLLVTKKRMAE